MDNVGGERGDTTRGGYNSGRRRIALCVDKNDTGDRGESGKEGEETHDDASKLGKRGLS